MESRLDKYINLTELGVGTYGVVYKAQGKKVLMFITW